MDIFTQIINRTSIAGLIKNTTWLIVDKLVNLVAGFLVGAWVARYLGPNQFGRLSYALAVSAMFLPLSQLGLADISIREIVRKKEDKDLILGTVYILQLFASISILVFIGFYILLFNKENIQSVFLVLILTFRLVFSAGSNAIDWWYQSQVKAKFSAWSRSLALLLTAFVLIGLILSNQSTVMFAWAYLVQSVLLFILAGLFYMRSEGTLKSWQFVKDLGISLLKDSWPLIISGVSIIIYMRIDQLMLNNMVSNHELGLYSVAVRLSELWYFIPVVLAASLFPSIIKAKESNSPERYKMLMQTFFDLMAMVSYLVVIPTILLGPWLIGMLFGESYVYSGNILQIHIWAFVFVSIGVARSRWLMAENLIRFSMKTTILGAVVNVILNLYLIPKYAGIGAAWSTLISYFVSAYLSTMFNQDLRPVFCQMSLSIFAPFRFRKIIIGIKDLLNDNQ